MELWNGWTSLLAGILTTFGGQLGLSEAASVILLTVLARVALMPVSLTSAIRSETNKLKMRLLKPEIDRLKILHKDDASKVTRETMRLYKERGVSLFDRLMIANIGTQIAIGLGVFQVLNRAAFSSRFLWIPNLAKPDVLLTVVVGALMLSSMALMPGATSETAVVAMVVSVAIATATLFALPSAVGVYWATSSAIAALQALVVRAVVLRRRGSAA